MDIEIKQLPGLFTVCQVPDFSAVDLAEPYTFAAATDDERSLVCPTDRVPAHTIAREDGWRGFRIVGVLDFSLIGILARIADLLARRGISIFAVSTYNTDYLLVKDAAYADALEALSEAGYTVR